MADLTLNPCSDCVAQAAYTKMLFSTDENDFTASGGAKRLHFLGEGLQKIVNKRNDQGITGDLWTLASRIHDGQNYVYGPLYFAMNAAEFAILAPHMVGPLDAGTAGSNLYLPTASCISPFHILILRDYGIFKYTDLYVASFQVETRSLQFREESLADMVVLAVNVIGKDRTLETDESNWPVADEPSLGTTAPYTIFFYKHSSLVIGGTSYGAYTKDVRLLVDRRLRPRYRMSTTPTSVCSYGRDVRFEMGMDWNASTKALIEQSSNSQGSITFGMDSTPTYWSRFHFGALVASDRDPVSKAKFEDVDFRVRNIGAAVDPSAGTYDIWAENKAA